jgi:hypothetical protein
MCPLTLLRGSLGPTSAAGDLAGLVSFEMLKQCLAKELSFTENASSSFMKQSVEQGVCGGGGGGWAS